MPLLYSHPGAVSFTVLHDLSKAPWERLTSFTSDLGLWFCSVFSLNSVNSSRILVLFVTEAKDENKKDERKINK